MPINNSCHTYCFPVTRWTDALSTFAASKSAFTLASSKACILASASANVSWFLTSFAWVSSETPVGYLWKPDRQRQRCCLVHAASLPRDWPKNEHSVLSLNLVQKKCTLSLFASSKQIAGHNLFSTNPEGTFKVSIPPSFIAKARSGPFFNFNDRFVDLLGLQLQ